MKRVIWIASYPKSGSTWFRLLLEGLFRPDYDLNDLRVSEPGVVPRKGVDELFNVDTADLLQAEVTQLKHAFRTWRYADVGPRAWVKTHEANGPSLPEGITQAAVYLVRNPLDVVPSLAAHVGCGIDAAIQLLEEPTATLSWNTYSISPTLEPELGTWSQHVTSWLDSAKFPVHVVRYEDLCANPVKQLNRVLKLLGVESTMARVTHAVEQAAFDRVRRLELARGFRAKPAGMPHFFRIGKPGSGVRQLTAAQQAHVLRMHGRAMRELGYLTGVSVVTEPDSR